MEKKRKSKVSTTPSHSEGTKDAADSLRTEIFAPEDFLTANDKISILSLGFLKNIYDLTKSHEKSSPLDNPLSLETERLRTPIAIKRSKKKKKRTAISKTEAPLPSLITENFDEDQVWEELELQNGFMYDNLVSSVSKLLAYKERSLAHDDSDSDVVTASEDEGMMATAMGGDQQELEDDDGDGEDSDFFESDEKYRKSKANLNQTQYKKSVVDDKFFSLAQMTEHIEKVEAELERGTSKQSGQEDDEDENVSSDEESIDLFEDVPSETDDEKDREEPTKYFYSDFFDPPLLGAEAKDRGSVDTNLEALSKKKSVSFADDDKDIGADEAGAGNDSDESEEEESGEENEDSRGKALGKQITETLSTFEKKRKKIDEGIEEIENEALQPKSWHLLGESTAETRPENALLEEHLVYDHLIRPAPEITMDTTMKLEDVIKLRIKDGAWDDVIRKVRPVEDPREYKKRLVLDAEKSKASLADIYEKEYLDQKKGEEEGQGDEKEPEEHIQIKKEMKILFQKLDALSNFHFTPKPRTAEVKIVSNMPSISVEETAAASISDANMLAPQEIQVILIVLSAYHASSSIKGKDERSSTDKNRERRKKKKKQHLKRLAEEEKARARGLGLRNIKLAEGIVKSQQKSRNNANRDAYSTSNQSGKELKSSKAFFAKLQEGAASHIDKIAKRKATSNSNNNLKSNLSAKKFKL